MSFTALPSAKQKDSSEANSLFAELNDLFVGKSQEFVLNTMCSYMAHSFMVMSNANEAKAEHLINQYSKGLKSTIRQINANNSTKN